MSRILLFIGTCGVLGASGCGAQLEEESGGRRQARQSLEYGPDLIVQEVSGPPSARFGELFTVSVTLCNQGNAGGSASVRLSLSDVSSPESQELQLADLSLDWWEEGQCSTEHVEVQVEPPHSGAWRLRAVADPDDFEPELSETNNAREGNVMGLGYGPDYVIQAVSSPASIEPGDPLPVSVTVCNQGTMAGSTFGWLMLSDGSQELPLQDLYTDWLEPGQCETQQVTVQATSEGAWFLKAMMQPDFWEELIDTNNTLVGNAVGVGVGPDYFVQAVSGPVSVPIGGLMTVSVRTCNQGTTGGATDVQLVLSDGTQDLPVSSFASGPLPAGQCSTRQVQVQAAAPHEGSWFLGAVADPAHSAPELIETNNALVGKTLGIGSSPDFIIQAVSAPASAQAEATFPVSVTVCNQGTTGGATDVQLEALSSDGEGIPRLPVGSFYTDWLAAGQCATQQWDAYIPIEGVWSLRAVADTWETHSEFSETNNTGVSALVGIGSAPDYVIQAVNAPAIIPGWGEYTASVTVCNQGTMDGSTDVQLVLSRDADIRFSAGSSSGSQDQPVASFATGLLVAGQCATQQVSVTAQWLGEGIWYLGAVANPSHSESEIIDTNNARASSVVGTGVDQDYVIQEVSAPANVQAGEPFTASVTVCNQGTNGDFSGTEVQVVLSEDTDIRFSNSGAPYHQDLPLQSFSTGSLMEGECMTQELQLSAQPPFGGSWHLGAVVDPGDSTSELIESNNSRASDDISFGL